MIKVCAFPVSRSTADWASIGSVVIVSQSIGTGTCSFGARCGVSC